MSFARKYLIFGGTGSLGRTLTKRILEKHAGIIDTEIIIFSRDESKHFKMKLEFPNVTYVIGDIRDYGSVLSVIKKHQPDAIINASAMKQVPICEDYPYEATLTNIVGAHNLVKAVESTYPFLGSRKEFCPKVLSISTDKCVKPVNSYGMTKALQERIHLLGSKESGIFNCVRYGNVLESTGSVIPFFKDRIKNNMSLPITHKSMTRFLLSLNQAVDLIFAALEDHMEGSKIFIPKVRSCKIVDLAEVMCEYYGFDKSNIQETSIRPGEKIHEILLSEEECYRTKKFENIYVVSGFKAGEKFNDIQKEYSSGDDIMNKDELRNFLIHHGALS